MAFFRFSGLFLLVFRFSFSFIFFFRFPVPYFSFSFSLVLVIPTGPPEARDGWASGGTGTGYSRELRRLIDDLRAAGVVNVIWLSGDVHFAAFFRHQIDDDYEMFEAIAGPLNAKVLPNPVFDKDLGSERLFIHPPAGDMTRFEAAVAGFNFGLVEIDAQGQAVVRYVNGNGRALTFS